MTLSESSHQVSSQTQMSGLKAGTPWESAPNAGKQAAGLISLLALLCQLITGLSGTLMHAPLTAIQLSSLLRVPYQYIRSYIFPEISQRCKELPTGDGFCSQRATQANCAVEKPPSVAAIEELCSYFWGLLQAHKTRQAKCTSGRRDGAGGRPKANSRRPWRGSILKQRSQFVKTEDRKTPLQQPDRRATLRVTAGRSMGRAWGANIQYRQVGQVEGGMGKQVAPEDTLQ